MVAADHSDSDSDTAQDRPVPPPPASIDADFFRNLGWLVWQGIQPNSPDDPPSGGLGDAARPYLLPLMLCMVQVYNVCGFYTVLVPSFFYKALVSVGDEHDSDTAGGSNSTSRSGSDGFGTMSPASAELLRQALVNAAIYLSLIIVVRTVMEFVTELSALQLRAGLTNVLTRGYFTGAAFYRCQLHYPHVDNPDQVPAATHDHHRHAVPRGWPIVAAGAGLSQQIQSAHRNFASRFELVELDG